MPNHTDIDAIIEGLSEAQKRCVRASSGRQWKKIWTIRRHAKIGHVRAFYGEAMWRCFDIKSDDPSGSIRLNVIGLSVRSTLLEARER